MTWYLGQPFVWAIVVFCAKVILLHRNITYPRSDVQFTSDGILVTLRSSKTIQFTERTVTIPVIELPGSILCPVRWLRLYLKYV